MQAAFVEFDGFQCGYCTSGQICSAIAMLREHAAGQASAVTEHLAAAPLALTDDEIQGDVRDAQAHPSQTDTSKYACAA